MIKPILGIDLDCTVVDMLPSWLSRYNATKRTNFTVSDIKEYDVGLVCTDQDTLYKILDEPGFFYNMNPMPGAEIYLQKLIDEGYDILIITQPPRRANRAVYDKRKWMKKYFNFSLENMIFCHRKELIKCDILFDDKPKHLINWKKNNEDGLTATLDWQFNKQVKTDFRGSLENGWFEFYNWVKSL